MSDVAAWGIIGTGWVGSSVAISTLHAGLTQELLLDDARVATESETITDAHPAAQNPIESVPQPQHGLTANQDSPGHIPLNASPAVRQAERLGSIDVANRRHIELDAGSL